MAVDPIDLSQLIPNRRPGLPIQPPARNLMLTAEDKWKALATGVTDRGEITPAEEAELDVLMAGVPVPARKGIIDRFPDLPNLPKRPTHQDMPNVRGGLPDSITELITPKEVVQNFDADNRQAIKDSDLDSVPLGRSTHSEEGGPFNTGFDFDEEVHQESEGRRSRALPGSHRDFIPESMELEGVDQRTNPRVPKRLENMPGSIQASLANQTPELEVPPVTEEAQPVTKPVAEEGGIPEPPSGTVPEAPDFSGEEETEEEKSTFQKFLRTAGIVVSGVAAARGDNAPLQAILASQIGQNKGKRLKREAKQSLKQQDFENAMELAKLNQANYKAEIEYWNATNKDGRKQLIEDGNKLMILDMDTGDTQLVHEKILEHVKTVDGMHLWSNGEWSKSTGSAEEVHGDVIYKKLTDGPNSILVPDRLMPDKEFVTVPGSPYLLQRSMEGGKIVTKQVITGEGYQRLLMDQQRFKGDQADRFQAVLNSVQTIKEHPEAERSANAIFDAAMHAKTTGNQGLVDVTVLQLFQRTVDDAVVREGDVRLNQMAASLKDRYDAFVIRAESLGQKQVVIPPKLHKEMVRLADRMLRLRRKQVKTETDKALGAERLILADENDNLGTMQQQVYDADVLRVEMMLAGPDADMDWQLYNSSADIPETFSQVSRLEAAGNVDALLEMANRQPPVVAALRAVDRLQAQRGQ